MIIKPNNNTISAITALPAAISTGKVLQVVEGTSTTQHNNSSTTATDIGLSVNITPSSSSNKVLVMANIPVRFDKSSNYYSNGTMKMVKVIGGTTTDVVSRSGSNVQDFGMEAGALGSSGNVTIAFRIAIQSLDSPSTTSEITYKIQSGGFASTTANSMWNGQKGSITAVEVEA